jgi:hypothetical protein
VADFINSQVTLTLARLPLSRMVFFGLDCPAYPPSHEI